MEYFPALGKIIFDKFSGIFPFSGTMDRERFLHLLKRKSKEKLTLFLAEVFRKAIHFSVHFVAKYSIPHFCRIVLF